MYQRIIINCDEDWRFTSGVRSRFLDLYRERHLVHFWDATRNNAQDKEHHQQIWSNWPEQLGRSAGLDPNAIGSRLEEHLANQPSKEGIRLRAVLVFIFRSRDDLSNGRPWHDFFEMLDGESQKRGWRSDLWIIAAFRESGDPDADLDIVRSGYVDNSFLLADDQPLSMARALEEEDAFDRLRALVDILSDVTSWDRIRRQATQVDRGHRYRLRMPKGSYETTATATREAIIRALNGHYNAIWIEPASRTASLDDKEPAKVESWLAEMRSIMSEIKMIRDKAPIALPVSDPEEGGGRGPQRSSNEGWDPASKIARLGDEFLTHANRNLAEHRVRFFRYHSKQLKELASKRNGIGNRLGVMSISSLGVGDPARSALDQIEQELRQLIENIDDEIFQFHQKNHQVSSAHASTATHRDRGLFRKGMPAYDRFVEARRQASALEMELVDPRTMKLGFLGLSGGSLIAASTGVLNLPSGTLIPASLWLLVLKTDGSRRLSIYKKKLDQLRVAKSALTRMAQEHFVSADRYHSHVVAKQISLEVRSKIDMLRHDFRFCRDYIGKVAASLNGYQDPDAAAERRPYLEGQKIERWLHEILRQEPMPEKALIDYSFLQGDPVKVESTFFRSSGRFVMDEV